MPEKVNADCRKATTRQLWKSNAVSSAPLSAPGPAISVPAMKLLLAIAAGGAPGVPLARLMRTRLIG